MTLLSRPLASQSLYCSAETKTLELWNSTGHSLGEEKDQNNDPRSWLTFQLIMQRLSL
jgi:hypothetical protein